MKIDISEDTINIIKTFIIFLIIMTGAALLMSFSEYSIASNIEEIVPHIPEEKRVYTEALITKINKTSDEYTVYAILDDDEEQLTRKLNFYSDEIKEDTKIPVYHEKGNYNVIYSEIVEPPGVFSYEKSLNKLKIFSISFVVMFLLLIGVNIFEKVFIKENN